MTSPFTNSAIDFHDLILEKVKVTTVNMNFNFEKGFENFHLIKKYLINFYHFPYLNLNHLYTVLQQ